VRHALAERNAVTTARQHHAATASLDEFNLTADAEAESQQATLQSLASLDAHQSQALTHGQFAQGEDSGQGEQP
jgi:hypothetical protein